MSLEPFDVAMMGKKAIDPDAQAWANIIGPSNTTPTEVALLSTYLKGVKSLGIGLDFFFFPAGKQVAQRMCVMRRVNLTEVSSPTWAANLGYTGDGAASCVNLNWAPNSGTHFAQNSGAIGCVVQTLDSRGATFYVAMGAFTGANSVSIAENVATFNHSINNNGVSNSAAAAGRWHVDRTASNLSTGFINAISKATEAAATSAPHAFNLFGLADNNAGTAQFFAQHIIGCWYGGGSFGGNVAAHDALLHTFLTGLNATNYP